jgi:hypothetical protein
LTVSSSNLPEGVQRETAAVQDLLPTTGDGDELAGVAGVEAGAGGAGCCAGVVEALEEVWDGVGGVGPDAGGRRLRGRGTRLLGVYSDPGHIVEYGDGEVRQEYELIFLGVGGYGSFRACQARPESVVR